MVARLLSSALVAKLAPLLFFGFSSDTLSKGDCVALHLYLDLGTQVFYLACSAEEGLRRTPPVDPTAPRPTSEVWREFTGLISLLYLPFPTV